jgi:cell division protein FtsZ
MEIDKLKFVMEEDPTPSTRIKVLGVGGGGCNAVARMLNEGLSGVEFCVMNTDAQALSVSPVPNRLAIGAKVTAGLGAGSDPEVGRQAALEDTDKIVDQLEGADMVFVTAGLGGGTGTGAAPVVASLAKELGALTVAVVTKPFAFEGPKRRKQAEKGLAELAAVVDTVITIPNDQLLALVPRGTGFAEAFRIADDVLQQAVQGISDIITTPGLVNRDFSDVRSIMTGMGHAMMGTASASGENACVVAAEKAINSPLMEAGGVRGARGVLINITGSMQLGLHEVNEACTLIAAATENEDVQINFGVVLDEAMGEEVKVTVIATGFVRDNLPKIERKAASPRDAEASRTPAAPESPVRTIPLREYPASGSSSASASSTSAAVPPVLPEPRLMEMDSFESAPPDNPEDEMPNFDSHGLDLDDAAPARTATFMSAPPVAPAPVPPPADQNFEDDLDVPAILRRDRRR